MSLSEPLCLSELSSFMRVSEREECYFVRAVGCACVRACTGVSAGIGRVCRRQHTYIRAAKGHVGLDQKICQISLQCTCAVEKRFAVTPKPTLMVILSMLVALILVLSALTLILQ